jgi:PAS domain S-box-containing protein
MSPDDNLAFMTWRARPDMSCEYVNRAWREFTGYTLEHALGEGWSRCLHPEDIARWLDAGVRAFDEREPFEIEYRLRRRDGEYRWILDRAAPRYGGDGLFLGFGGACVDVDGQKREQHSLARALERERRLRIATEEASRLRHGLMVSVLQELRAPAQAIATWAAHLREQGAQAGALQAIERNARTQSRIISNLLQLEEEISALWAEGPLLSGVRVLVVGLKDAVSPLQVAGADVRVAATNADALQTLGDWRPDVLLCESDESFIRTLRALPAERGGCLRTAALTEHGDAPAGYDAQLAKPVEPVALLATVARLAA